MGAAPSHAVRRPAPVATPDAAEVRVSLAGDGWVCHPERAQPQQLRGAFREEGGGGELSGGYTRKPHQPSRPPCSSSSSCHRPPPRSSSSSPSSSSSSSLPLPPPPPGSPSAAAAAARTGGAWPPRWRPNPWAAACRDAEDVLCAFLVVFFTLVTAESLAGAGAAAAFTMLFIRYEFYGAALAANVSWAFVSFALVLPLTTAITTSFRRREDALRELAGLRAAAQCLLTAHCEWDWCPPAGPKDGWGGRASAALEGHEGRARAALARALGALEAVLGLPCVTRARHSVFRQRERDAVGARRAHGVADVWRAMAELSALAEDLKRWGMPGNEAARMRQFEQSARRHIQGLLHVKDYRTPQQLRSLSRVLILVHPALLGPYYSWLAGYGRGQPYPHANVAFALFAAVATTLVLYGLYNTEHSLEDPFEGDGWEKVHVRLDFAELAAQLDAIAAQATTTTTPPHPAHAPDFGPGGVAGGDF